MGKHLWISHRRTRGFVIFGNRLLGGTRPDAFSQTVLVQPNSSYRSAVPCRLIQVTTNVVGTP